MRKFLCLCWLVGLLWGVAWGQPRPSESPDAVEPTPVVPSLVPDVIAPFGNDGEQVYLQGLPLFRVHSTPGISASDRSELLERRLEHLLADAGPYDVEVKRDKEGYYLSCRGRALITVHEQDAEAAGLTTSALAIRWAKSVEATLERTRQEKGIEFLRQASMLCLAALLVCLLLDRLLRRLTLRYLQTTGISVRLLNGLVWITVMFWQFPATRPLANQIGLRGVWPLLTFMLVASGAFFASYLLGRGVRHYFRQLELAGERRPQASPRWRQRLHMLRQVVYFVVNCLLTALAIVIFFSLLEVNLGAVVAGAGFISVGLGLAAQNVLKDWIAGVNIVTEDQFGDGDIIATGGFEGVVEHFTLRITQLRDMSGNLITIPNSQIQVVKNQSNVWSQVDLSIPVSYRADTRRAMELLAEVSRQLARDWPDQLDGEPEMLGVEELGSYFVRLRMLQRTAPQQQFPVRRELLLRVKETFAREGIEIPIQEFRVASSGSPDCGPGGDDHLDPASKRRP